MEKAAAEGERRRLNSAPAEGGESSMIYQLNGAIYLLNQNVFQQSTSGAMEFRVYIGMHDPKSEVDQTYKVTEIVDGTSNEIEKTKKVAPQDWMLLQFFLTDKTDRKGLWQCVDGFSDFSIKSHSLSSTTMNGFDKVNDCMMNKDQMKMTIGNSKLTTKMQFYRLFKTKDVS